MGHSLKRQGAQDTGCRTSWASTPNGDVVCQSVGPNTATSGTLKAAATCMGPVSFVRNNWQRFTSAINSRTVVWPEHTTVRVLIWSAMAFPNGSSPLAPKIATPTLAPDRPCTSVTARLTTSAYRSGNHRLAWP